MSPVTDTGAELRDAVQRALPRLEAIGIADSARRPAPGKWSAREIIGHLVDSAINNHGRFVRGQLSDELVFQGYAQNDWVLVQGYQDASWPDLVVLWSAINTNLARVISLVPRDVATREHSKHNLHEVAFTTIPASQPATLEYFMRDYVAHLEHHLRQVWEAVA